MMVLNKSSKICVLLLALSLNSCSLFRTPDPEIITVPVYIDRHVPIQERPRGLNPLPVKFYAVSDLNLAEFLSNNRKRNGILSFVAVDVAGYENLALNTSDIKRWGSQMVSLVEYYEEQNKKVVINESIKED